MNFDIPDQPKDGKTWKEVNKEHYDNLPEDTFKIKWIADMHRQIIEYLTTNSVWIGIPEGANADKGTGIRLLDYACGNGVISTALAPYASHIRGADISSTMVQRYNEAAEAAGFAPERMRAAEADLAAGSDPALAKAAEGDEFQGFNMALISMALHHVEHPVAVIQGMASRLAPGGKLLVIDLNLPEGEAATGPPAGHGHGHDHGHAHSHDHSHGHDHHGHNHDHAHDHAHAHDHSHSHDHNCDHSNAEAPGGLHTVVHRGFSEKDMLRIFNEAGLVNGEVRLNPTVSDLPPQMGSGKLRLFFGVAEKPKA
ncbi:hypothetical protein Sste5346_002950 [Sporothrix stenoceras]|uniref:Methyltransferase domain-containing protein n=1 Tax=Sporothrix stenoceras TaxID=5173 RepID=A0ABR3ZIA0_9PEZI